jgi:hypothetical protein
VVDACTELGLLNLNQRPFESWIGQLGPLGDGAPRFVAGPAQLPVLGNTWLKSVFVSPNFQVITGETDGFTVFTVR